MMTEEKVKRFNSYLEILKSCLLGMLVISMIALVVVYIRGSHVYESISLKNKGELKSFDKLWSIEGGAAAESLDGSRLLPEFIGYRQAGAEMACAAASIDAVSDLYELIKPCILELFGSDSSCRELSALEGEQRFERAIGSDEFIFLRYHVPVLYQLAFAYASDKLTIAETDIAVGANGSVSAYISELIILPDMEYAAAAHRYIAYAHDGEGRYFEFRPNDYIVTSSFYTSKLAESGAGIGTHPFSFAEDERLPSTQPIIDAELEYTVIAQTEPNTTDEAVLIPLLRLFGYNPDKLNSYVDDTGANVYVDSGSRLRVASDTISFATNDAVSGGDRGISIDSMLGYSSDDTFNLFDQLTAADNFIRSLGAISLDLIGGEASLCLGSVYSSNTQLVIEYFMTYNNIRISSAPALRIVLTQETISRVELSPISIVGTNEISHSLQPSFTLRKLIDLGMLPEEGSLGGLRMMYSGSDAAWSVILK